MLMQPPRRPRASVSAFAAMALALSIGAPPARAEGAADPVRVTQAALRLFNQGCIRNLRQEAGLREVLQAAGLRAAPAEQATPHLGGRPGTLFVSSDPGLPLAVIVRPEAAQCEVRSPTADVELAETEFRNTVEGLAGPKVMIRRESEQRSSAGGRPSINVVFSAGAPPLEEGGARLAMQAREPVPGGIALSMTASGRPLDAR
ncbi:MAG: hypothetical protein ICV73_18205 [Acetobacteraceae bacterium]|nr:hypothetical protein [Acetobacteraceae bacterium]